ncbi:MAG TPA: Ig-like domain-containing protein [Pyrinomonadaceae bacterium]|nr:Ig-like domain-containing protein [Pyrinomonadaceae bacterium]
MSSELSVPTRYITGLFTGALLCGFIILNSANVLAQAPTFAGNAQHTSVYTTPAQNLNAIKWSTTIDFHPTTTAHYGAPVITANNTVLVPVKTSTDGFRVDAFNGNNGTAKYIINTDYILPAHNWVPVYNPCIATGSFGTRLYYAGAGGTILYIDNPDSNSPGAPVKQVFYTSLAGYNANAAAYNNAIFVNTPLTADADGNIYFGFRVQGTAPAPLNTTQSGIARIDANGNATYVLAAAAASDGAISRVSHNVAPALSSDGSTLYVVVKWATNNSYAYLLGLNSSTLATKYSMFLRDPRNGNPASVPDDATSSPVIAPDGDVYFGVLAANSGSRGFLLRFSGDLSVTKTPGGFGWDYTPGIVPASMVPSYTGSSSYLIFAKYNDYPFADGSGVNRVALLDPNATQIDPHTSAGGLIEMREVLTVIAPTPDPDVNPSVFPLAGKEWCINAPAVNPANKSVYFTSEDGRSYRWNLATNALDQSVVLSPGVLEPYVPTVIGPDGTVYTLNGGIFFALGNRPGVNVTIDSSAPDSRSVVVGSAITFTATVTGTPASPTGTVTFTDLTYNGLTPVTTTLASNVPLSANGTASMTTSALAAGGNFRGSHFITAAYSGDGGHPASSVTMVQKVHANATNLTLNSSQNPINFGQAVTFTATVSSVPTNAGTPTGMVTFQDGGTVVWQAPLNSSGVATFNSTSLVPGSHNIVATYASDTQFAASTGGIVQVVQNGTSTAVTSSANPASFGQSIMFDATVTAANGAPGIPSGSVTFREGSTVLGTATLNSAGHALFSYSAFSIGSHNVTADFAGTNGWLASSGQVEQVVLDAPLLLIDDSQRVIALDLVTQTRDPFSLTNPFNLSPDLRRRVSLFVWRLGLMPGDGAADLTVVAEDDQGGSYTLVVEHVTILAGVTDVTQVVVRLPDNVSGAPRDLQTRVKLHGLFSNKGLIGISGN